MTIATVPQIAVIVNGLPMPTVVIDFDMYAAVANPNCRRCHGTGLVAELDGIDVDMPGGSVSWPTGEYLPCPVCNDSEIPF
jgi:hypothetical protein